MLKEILDLTREFILERLFQRNDDRDYSGEIILNCSGEIILEIMLEIILEDSGDLI